MGFYMERISPVFKKNIFQPYPMPNILKEYRF